jgi:hypothetical protein
MSADRREKKLHIAAAGKKTKCNKLAATGAVPLHGETVHLHLGVGKLT